MHWVSIDRTKFQSTLFIFALKSIILVMCHFRWKELFPELMKLLGDMPKIIVTGEVKTGSEYCDSQMKTLLAARWPETVLSSIGAMFL